MSIPLFNKTGGGKSTIVNACSVKSLPSTLYALTITPACYKYSSSGFLNFNASNIPFICISKPSLQNFVKSSLPNNDFTAPLFKNHKNMPTNLSSLLETLKLHTQNTILRMVNGQVQEVTPVAQGINVDDIKHLLNQINDLSKQENLSDSERSNLEDSKLNILDSFLDSDSRYRKYSNVLNRVIDKEDYHSMNYRNFLQQLTLNDFEKFYYLCLLYNNSSDPLAASENEDFSSFFKFDITNPFSDFVVEISFDEMKWFLDTGSYLFTNSEKQYCNSKLARSELTGKRDEKFFCYGLSYCDEQFYPSFIFSVNETTLDKKFKGWPSKYLLDSNKQPLKYVHITSCFRFYSCELTKRPEINRLTLEGNNTIPFYGKVLSSRSESDLNKLLEPILESCQQHTTQVLSSESNSSSDYIRRLINPVSTQERLSYISDKLPKHQKELALIYSTSTKFPQIIDDYRIDAYSCMNKIHLSFIKAIETEDSLLKEGREITASDYVVQNFDRGVLDFMINVQEYYNAIMIKIKNNTDITEASRGFVTIFRGNKAVNVPISIISDLIGWRSSTLFVETFRDITNLFPEGTPLQASGVPAILTPMLSENTTSRSFLLFITSDPSSEKYQDLLIGLSGGMLSCILNRGVMTLNSKFNFRFDDRKVFHYFMDNTFVNEWDSQAYFDRVVKQLLSYPEIFNFVTQRKKFELVDLENYLTDLQYSLVCQFITSCIDDFCEDFQFTNNYCKLIGDYVYGLLCVRQLFDDEIEDRISIFLVRFNIHTTFSKQNNTFYYYNIPLSDDLQSVSINKNSVFDVDILNCNFYDTRYLVTIPANLILSDQVTNNFPPLYTNPYASTTRFSELWKQKTLDKTLYEQREQICAFCPLAESKIFKDFGNSVVSFFE